ncbi:MAG: TldD/PmbA family protein [Bryobacteraceae bacterium]
MMESELMTMRRCRELFEAAVHAARAAGVADVEVLVGVRASALTRFANNTIHQNVSDATRYVSVRPLIGKRTARASTNRIDRDGIRSVVQEAIAIARASEPDPDLLPLAEPAPIASVSRFFASTAALSPEDRARGVLEAIRAVESERQTAAGIYSTGQTVDAVLNTNGVEAYHLDSLSQFSITAMAEDSSGWAKASAPDHNAFQPVELARSASRKAALSREPRELPPGRYTVVLEPAAVLDLVGQIFADFSGTALADQKSFLNNRMGQQLFGTNIHIADDVYHPLQTGAPFDGEGVPRRRLALVEAGVPREVARCRLNAAKVNDQPTGHGFPLPNEQGEAPVNIVIAGGDTPLEKLIASTGRGILVTRLWYIREVDPFEKIMTGMTRDGTFLIEGGEPVCGLRNFRFNQGIIELLRNVEALSPCVRSTGEEAMDMVAPAMKVHDFHFSEVTRF